MHGWMRGEVPKLGYRNTVGTWRAMVDCSLLIVDGNDWQNKAKKKEPGR